MARIEYLSNDVFVPIDDRLRWSYPRKSVSSLLNYSAEPLALDPRYENLHSRRALFTDQTTMFT